MVRVGHDEFFSCYNILQQSFPFDILFIKDIGHGLWYLTIMEECRTLIENITREHNYKHVFGITDSSGTIPLLNIAPYLSQFREGIVINGQTTLKPEIIEKYKSCTDCAIFDPVSVGNISQSYLIPLEKLSNSQLQKIRYYYNNSPSDYQYYLYTLSFYTILDNTCVTLTKDNGSHISYITKVYGDASFMKTVADKWLAMIN